MRVGYSGDDSPAVVIPSCVGVLAGGAKYVFGNLELALVRPSMQVCPVISATGVTDWALLEAILDYAVVKCMGAKWEEFPVIIAENASWDAQFRPKVTTLLFETFGVPAVYLARAPVLSAFAMGKHTALVVDCGASAVRVSPVYDGYLIKSGALFEEAIGGDAVSAQLKAMLKVDIAMETVRIPQEVLSKDPVALGAPPAAVISKEVEAAATASYIAFHQSAILDDIKESIVQVAENAFSERDLAMRPPKFYEFSDGFNKNFGLERFRIGEYLLDPAHFGYAAAAKEAVDAASSAGEKDAGREERAAVSGIVDLITRSLQLCDVEVRTLLIGNLILTGSGSSLTGLSERLSSELNRMPAYGRVRVQVGASSQERRFGVWIGGSILASLATFNQLWITREDFKEHGAEFVDRKCT